MFAGEREDVQKRTFTKWMNSRLVRANKQPIQNFVEDLRDGIVLMQLLEILTGKNLNPERGSSRVHQLNNVDHIIKFMEKHYNIKLVNISSDDVVDGNLKLILGLVWNIVLHWQVCLSLCLIVCLFVGLFVCLPVFVC
ncbi:hypothetical protein HELRODRAFT_86724 [Helobdella robusta]|uniref:Calponin-homology (CH) domain-containing protein n=1 Tax=Helobdella robusta TaxID=6412 RepID=T1G6G1_HELRO|nr:hypothetical protein HELRODRAFT_86724 [Helobdella robusta]ESN95570.1 hypothetical protein HELRODRAFT_86724 [Helobdella robusta]